MKEESMSTKEALAALLEIKCKVDAEGCDGPWCTAREKIKKAFSLGQDEEDEDEIDYERYAELVE